MSVGHVLSTAGLPHDERMAYWVQAVRENFREVDVESSARACFTGTIETHSIGPLGLAFMSADEQRIVRARPSYARMGGDLFHLVQSRDRPVRLLQAGMVVELTPGGCALIDGRRPFEITLAADRDFLCVALPLDWLMTWLPEPEAAVMRPWSPGGRWGGVLASALSNIDRASLAGLPVLPSVFCDQIGALVAMAAGGADDGRSVRPGVVDRLRGTLEGAFRDPDLRPDGVARGHGISLRFLHHQFASSGTTFGAELLRIRLEDARRMLADPRCGDLPVHDVAMRCGFVNASHFARRFRQRFGTSPSDARGGCAD